MNARLFHTVTMLTACLTACGGAATLFSDNYQDAAASNAQWAYPAAITHTIANGAVTLKNTDTTYLWFATHNMASKAPVFTLSATITITSPASNGVGIACCLDANNNGIGIQVGTGQSLFVYKYDSNVQQLLGIVNSFITPGVNTIKVSKRDSTFNVFCNGAFITTFSVSTAKFLGGGDIGVLLPDKGQAVFDDVIMTDQYETGAPINCFSDNFTDANLNGWYVGVVMGLAQSTGGALALTNTDASNSSIPFVNGNFDRASYRVIASFKSGSGPYGLAIVFPVQVSGGVAYKPYSFVIDSARHYGFGHPDSASIKLSPVKTYIHASTGDGKDTLEVLRFSKKYKFRINGTVAEDSLPLRGSGSVVSAGLFVLPKTAVVFDDFVIGGDSAGAACSIITLSGKPYKAWTLATPFAGSDYMLFDLTGRLVKRLCPTSAGLRLPMAHGMYILRKADNPSLRVKAQALLR